MEKCKFCLGESPSPTLHPVDNDLVSPIEGSLFSGGICKTKGQTPTPPENSDSKTVTEEDRVDVSGAAAEVQSPAIVPKVLFPTTPVGALAGLTTALVALAGAAAAGKAGAGAVEGAATAGAVTAVAGAAAGGALVPLEAGAVSPVAGAAAGAIVPMVVGAEEATGGAVTAVAGAAAGGALVLLDAGAVTPVAGSANTQDHLYQRLTEHFTQGCMNLFEVSDGKEQATKMGHRVILHKHDGGNLTYEHLLEARSTHAWAGRGMFASCRIAKGATIAAVPVSTKEQRPGLPNWNVAIDDPDGGKEKVLMKPESRCAGAIINDPWNILTCNTVRSRREKANCESSYNGTVLRKDGSWSGELLLTAARDILPYEELTWCYGDVFDQFLHIDQPQIETLDVEALDDDLSQLLQFFTYSLGYFPTAYKPDTCELDTVEKLREHMSANSGLLFRTTLLFEKDGEQKGEVACMAYCVNVNTPHVRIDRICTLPKFRELGVAQITLSTMCENLKLAHFETLRVSFPSGTPFAVGLLTQCGFNNVTDTNDPDFDKYVCYLGSLNVKTPNKVTPAYIHEAIGSRSSGSDVPELPGTYAGAAATGADELGAGAIGAVHVRPTWMAQKVQKRDGNCLFNSSSHSHNLHHTDDRHTHLGHRLATVQEFKEVLVRAEQGGALQLQQRFQAMCDTENHRFVLSPKYDNLSLKDKTDLVLDRLAKDASKYRGKGEDWVTYWGGNTEVGLLALKFQVHIASFSKKDG